MIELDLSRAKRFLSDEDLEAAKKKADKAFKKVHERSGKGAEWLGWRDMLEDPNDALIEQLGSLATDIRAEADVFIVCGRPQ